MFDARKIANLILSEFDAVRFEISNLKLNKILFYVHAYHLVRQSQPLIKNHFEAWEHGPVVRVVYHEFKKFGSKPITSLARHVDYESGREEIISFSEIDASTRDFVLSIGRHYMRFTASQLRDMTHQNDSPWSRVYSADSESRGLRDRIPNELIEAHFASIIGKNKSLN